MGNLTLGLQLGYWGALYPSAHVDMAVAAEKLGFDSVWTAESWGNDCFTPLAWIGAHTSRIRLGTGVAQLSARTPASCAMATIALDHMTNGRMILGLGVSGPQVVEGWYGQPYSKPVSRTREYVSIIRQILAREGPVTIEVVNNNYNDVDVYAVIGIFTLIIVFIKFGDYTHKTKKTPPNKKTFYCLW